MNTYGADATRFALADAGDGIGDGNFDESVANSAILRMKTFIDWCTVSPIIFTLVIGSLCTDFMCIIY